jgi:6-phosphofructokinase 1
MMGSVMGAYAVDCLCAGKSNRVVALRKDQMIDFDIDEALAMEKSVNDYEYDICYTLAR